MKKFFITAIILLAFAQISNAQIRKEDLIIAQTLLSKEKKDAIGKYLQLDYTPSNAKFWRLYDAYEAKRNLIMVERMELLTDYSNSYFTLTDGSAIALAEKFMSIDVKMNKLNRQYYKKFSAVIGGLHATALFQIELYVQTALQAKAQSQIPIIGEIQKIHMLGAPAEGTSMWKLEEKKGK